MTFRIVYAFALATAFMSVGAPSADAGSRAENQPIFAYKGNTYIIRKTHDGDTTHLRAYRLAGDQWEPYGATSVPSQYAKSRKLYRGTRTERIYAGGRLLGYSSVDLDKPYNTLLNKNLRAR